MKTALLVGGVLALAAFFKRNTISNLLSDKNQIKTSTGNMEYLGSFYDFKIKSLDNKDLDLSQYKGKKVVLVNVASKCGFTPQYADWEKFHETYGDKIVVIGIPANNFMSQEPGSNSDIAEFCQKNYGVNFQMTEKVEVIGEKQHPLYQWLSKKNQNGWNDQAPTWNFCKYVINEDGKVTHFFASKILPTSEEFKKAVGI
jgi:glutathione peroxidase